MRLFDCFSLKMVLQLFWGTAESCSDRFVSWMFFMLVCFVLAGCHTERVKQTKRRNTIVLCGVCGVCCFERLFPAIPGWFSLPLWSSRGPVMKTRGFKTPPTELLERSSLASCANVDLNRSSLHYQSQNFQ